MPDLAPTETWEIFGILRQLFGRSYLQKIYRISESQVYRWSRNPKIEYENPAQRNPLDTLESILSDLIENGHRDVVIAILARLSRVGGFELIDADLDVEPDRETAEAELLDNYEALADYTRLAREYAAGSNGVEFSHVQAAADKACREIRQDKTRLVAARRSSKSVKVARIG